MEVLTCPYHGRVDIDALTFSCSCGCFEHTALNDVIDKLNENRNSKINYIKGTSDPKEIIKQIRKCPNNKIVKMYCGICENGKDISYFLKPDFNFSNKIVTSFLGDSGSGKSNMIACLYKLILKFSNKRSEPLYVLPPQIYQDFIKIYINPLFNPKDGKHYVVPKTQKEALFYFEVGEKHNIFFYDSPGDDLLDFDSFTAFQYVRESNCIVLLISPESYIFLKKYSMKKMKSSVMQSKYNPTIIFTNTISQFPDKKLKKIIIVLTKADNFFRVGYRNPFSVCKKELANASADVMDMYLENPHTSNVDYNWIDRYSDKCEKFLSLVDEELNNLIIKSKEKSEKTLFFFVSSFGDVDVKQDKNGDSDVKQEINGDSDVKIDKNGDSDVKQGKNGNQYLEREPQPTQLDNIFYSIIKN